LARILDAVKQQNARITDDFPIRLAETYEELLREKRRLPSSSDWIRRASVVRTAFYRENRHLKKKEALGEIAKAVESLGKTKEFKAILAASIRVFISHSNVFSAYQHFVKTIHGAGYETVVAEKSPNRGKSWHPGQKVQSLMKECGVVVVVLTPDDLQTKLPRGNVLHEIGLAEGLKLPIVFLKAKETKLPSNVNPTYTSFRLDHPEDADSELLLNLNWILRPGSGTPLAYLGHAQVRLSAFRGHQTQSVAKPPPSRPIE